MNYTVIYFLIGSMIRSSALAVTISFACNLLGAFVFGCIGHFLHISGLADYALGNVALAVESVNINTVSVMHLVVITAVILLIGFIGVICFKKQDVK